MKSQRLFLLLFLLSNTLSSLGQQAALDTFIKAFVKEHHFNGTILIQKNSIIQYHKSFGLANRPFQVPAKLATKYKIASITKLFTAVLTLQLFEQGKLDLHKPIHTYLPQAKGEAARKVTVHQLLNHTSGLATMDTVTSMNSALKNGIPFYQRPYTTEGLLMNALNNPPLAEAGTAFYYNNSDYVVLGKIIEQITGKAYEQVLFENILRPLHMDRSGLLYQSSIVEGLADTYFYREDLQKLVNDLPVYIENWYAAGAMFSTTEDLLRFSQALFGGRLIKKETLAMLMKPALDDYGYGVWVDEWKLGGRKYRTVQRPGSIMGAQCKLVHIIEANVTIVILSNTSTASVDEFAYSLGKVVLR